MRAARVILRVSIGCPAPFFKENGAGRMSKGTCPCRLFLSDNKLLAQDKSPTGNTKNSFKKLKFEAVLKAKNFSGISSDNEKYCP